MAILIRARGFMSATSRSDASSSSPIDPITVAVVSNRLFGIVQEMGEAMLRTSYSQILNSSRDFSVALCDAKGRLIAQAEHIPIHVGAMPFALQSVLTAFGDDVHPGDIFLMNDPYHGGSHLPDLTAIIPVYDGERLAYWSLNRAHQSDIGGATHGAYNPAATEIWQEGFRVPPIRLGQNGKMRDDLVAMLAANVRHPRDFLGDLAAMIGSAQLGARRMASLIGELGGVKLDAALEALLDASERQARAVISTWKDGVYKGEAFLDDDGRGNDDIAIRATVTKQGSELTVDLSDSAPQVASFVNSSYANTCSAVVAAIAYLMDPDTPKNAGSSRPLKIIAKEGTIVWSRPGAPVTMCTSHCSNEIIEAVVRALAGACPDRAMAGWGRRFRISIKGERPAHGQGFHLAYVPCASRRRRVVGRRRLAQRRRVALRRWPQVRQRRGGRSALSPAFPQARAAAWFGRRWAVSRRRWRRPRIGDADHDTIRRQHGGRWHPARRGRHARRQRWRAASLCLAFEGQSGPHSENEGGRRAPGARRCPRGAFGRRRRLGAAGKAHGASAQSGCGVRACIAFGS